MSKSNRRSEANDRDPEQLADAVNRLSDEVRVLRNAIDEFREIFTHAVRSDRLPRRDSEEGSTATEAEEGPSQTEQDDGQHDRIATVVEESLRDVAGDLEAVVRDELKQELAAFRDSLDAFSLDIQWAARRVCQAGSDHRTESASRLAGQGTGDDHATTRHPAAASEPSDHSVRQSLRDDPRQPLLWLSE